MGKEVLEVAVLYVEDDPPAREAVSEILKRIIRTVYVEENGKDGLEAFKQHNPDIVITDIRMPVMSGLDMARKIREESSDKQIIVTTAHSDTDYFLEAIDIAVDQYILKPVQSDSLIAAVRKCANHVLNKRDVRKYNEEREKLILELQDANAAIEQQLRFTETLLGAIPIAAFYKDTEGRYLGCNNEFAKIMGITPEDIVGKRVFDVWPREQAHIYHQKDMELLQNPAYQIYEYKVTGHEGKSIDVICHKDVFRDEKGLVRGIIGTFLDITERKKAESELRLHSEILANMAEGVFLIRTEDGKIVYTNQKFERMFGYGSGELVGKHVSIVNAPSEKSPEETSGEIIQSLNANGVWQGEVQSIRKDGTTFWCNKNVTTNEHSQYGKVWISINQDITKRKLIEAALRQSEEKFRILFESATDALFIIDMEEQIIEINTTAYSRLGYTKDEMLSMNMSELDTPEFAIKLPKRIDDFKKHCHSVFESEHLRKDSTVMPVEVNGRIIDFGGKSVVFSVVRDITEHKRAEKQMRRSLREKETLLKEIHHRVKNNLAVISSLLRLQALGTNDESLSQALEESQQRIKSMALVHEHLYQARDFSCINYKDFINDIVEQLEAIHQKRNGTIVTNLKIEDLTLDIDSAIPCSLIINELITNAYKYAFPDNRSGELSIRFAKEDDTYILSIKDNGIGLPEGFDYRKSNTLGLQIVNVLCKQLRATLQMRSDRGTEAVITFKSVGN